MHISWNCRHEIQYSTIFIKYVSFIAPCYIYQKRFSYKPTYISIKIDISRVLITNIFLLIFYILKD